MGQNVCSKDALSTLLIIAFYVFSVVIVWIPDQDGESVWGVDPPTVLYYWSSAQETTA